MPPRTKTANGAPNPKGKAHFFSLTALGNADARAYVFSSIFALFCAINFTHKLYNIMERLRNRVACCVGDGTWDWLSALADARRTTISHIVREIVEASKPAEDDLDALLRGLHDK